MTYVMLIAQGLIIGSLCSYVASQKNRNGSNWFVLGFFLSILALIALVAIPPLPEDEDTDTDTSQLGNSSTRGSSTRKCPFCAEEIAVEAIKCKYCKEYLNKIPDEQNISDDTTINCPFCAEKIPSDTKECKHCGEKFVIPVLDSSGKFLYENALTVEEYIDAQNN